MSTEEHKPAWVPSEARLVAQYARSRAEKEVDGYETAKADAERGITKIKADARRSLLNELLADAEQEADIGRQGNDDERVKAAETVIDMLNDTRIEEEA